LKAIGEEVSEVVAGSAPSPADTGVVQVPVWYRYRCGTGTGAVRVLKHSRNPRERRAESLKGIGPELSEQRGELQTDASIFIYIDYKYLKYEIFVFCNDAMCMANLNKRG
jgi:hypothetical protein